MRQIKFRGKGRDSGEWLYGSLLLINEQSLIVPFRDLPDNEEDGADQNVIPGTVGQLTPFTDRTGLEMYEGDVVQEYIMGDLFEVVFTDYGNFGLKPISEPAARILQRHEYENIDPSYASTSLTVIGNIHDNHELINQ